MPPPSSSPSLHLLVLEGRFFVEKFPSGKSLPSWVVDDIANTECGTFFSVTRTEEEVSVVGLLDETRLEDIQKLSPWVAIKIKGPMEHSLTGILADFSVPLKAAKVPIFAISTWNTDYILLPRDKFTKGKEALISDGWTFE